VQAVDDYWAAIGRIEENPSAFSESEMRAILKKVAGDQVVAANVSSYLDLAKRQYRYDGAIAAISTKVAEPSKPSYGVEVVVTRCVDQRSLKVIDRSGQEVDDSTLGYRIPEFNLRQYTVIKRTNSPRFLVYGLASAKGECRA